MRPDALSADVSAEPEPPGPAGLPRGAGPSGERQRADELEELAARYVHALAEIVEILTPESAARTGGDAVAEALALARHALAGRTPQYWTTTDVAAFLNVKTGTVSMYRKREQMPSPDLVVGRTACWHPERIRRWHAARPRAGS